VFRLPATPTAPLGGAATLRLSLPPHCLSHGSMGAAFWWRRKGGAAQHVAARFGGAATCGGGALAMQSLKMCQGGEHCLNASQRDILFLGA